MDKDKLYELLDIESGEDFQYFENLANLVESEEDIDDELVYLLLSEVDLGIFSELVESYFYDISETIPDKDVEFYTLLETIKRNLSGMAQAATEDEEENVLRKLAEEVNRFRSWYSVENNVAVTDSNGDTVFKPVRDALIDARMERIGGGRKAYDFTEALGYPLDEYVMTYGDMVDDE